MEREFTISTGKQVFNIAIAVFIAGFALYLFTLDHSKAGSAVLRIPILLLLFAGIIIVNQVKSKVIISEYKVTRINVFRKRELQTADIKGARIGQKVIYIEPISATNPKITITNYIDLDESEYLVQWLRENFKDLNSIDLDQEQNKVFQDERLGSTPEERKERLKATKRVAWIYNIAGMALGFAIIPLESHSVSAILLLSYPLLGIAIIIFSRGLTKFMSSTERSAYSFVMLGVMMPAFTMLLKSLEYEILQYSHIWLPTALFGSVVFIVLLKVGINNSIPIKSQIVSMAIAAFLYGYGSTIQVNCVFDRSSPQAVHTSVYGKFKNYSRGEHYYLRLNPFSPDQKTKDIEVSEETYDKYSQGSNIAIEIKKGALNIPWYYLAQYQ